MKNELIGLLACVFFLIRCIGNNPSANVGTSPAADSLSSKQIAPDNNDLIRALQGKWKSDSNPDIVLEVTGSRIRHWNGTQLSVENEIEADGLCAGVACKEENGGLDDGWCFSEKGEFDINCYRVLQCDKNKLHIKTIGATNGDLSFQKIE